MTAPTVRRPRRILVVDDMPEIHALMRSMLAPSTSAHATEQAAALNSMESALFGESVAVPLTSDAVLDVEIDDAHQGQDAVEMVRLAEAANLPYYLAFVDMRMPPGIDGVETISRMWEHSPDLYTVICTAYSDYGWQDILSKLGSSPNLLLLRKPFESIEVRQIAYAIGKMYDILAGVRASVDRFDAELVALSQRIVRTEARTRAVADAFPDAVILVNHSSEILSVNAAAESLLRMRAEDLVGKRCDMFIRPADDSTTLRSNAATGEPKRFRGSVCTDGSTAPGAKPSADLEIICFPVSLPAGADLEQLLVCRPLIKNGSAHVS